MINSISGKIFKKEPTVLYVENNGIVFSISICLRDYEKLPSENENVFIYTYLNVKENLMELYGFMGLERRSLFLNLIDVSGIGPRTAINLLSNASVSSFKENIVSEDVKSLSLIPGIGPKTAKRIILDIKEKIVSKPIAAQNLDNNKLGFTHDDIFTALSSLGYKKSQIDKAIKKLSDEGSFEGDIENVIKRILAIIR
ncbi:MAG: Holliday junction branch migration protein RuvA [Candidatus Marinimicrobia bacterium]|nr:Holliday junction branch migration protein RuvA [Candidatus Neomarinimicrobiota bacterium]|tara:strand:+ start:8255 stop:8848 length:594 start_codon:yes stop_codon:yes gene_type:complete